jgi:hypothetical protein
MEENQRPAAQEYIMELEAFVKIVLQKLIMLVKPEGLLV